MKLMLVAVLCLAAVTGPSAAVRFEADGVRVGSELVTGAAVSLKESGALPVLVSGSVVESLSGDSLAVALGGKQVVLGAGLRLARTADGFVLSTHGMPFKVESAGLTLSADRSAAFKVTEKGFDFGALGAIEGASFAARVTTAVAPVVAVEPPQQVEISPEKPVRQGRNRVIRRLYSADPLIPSNAATSVALRQLIGVSQVTPDGSP